MEHQKIRWGILGPGVIARQFAHDFPFTQHAELSAVASTNAARANAFGKEFDIPKIYAGYEALLNDPDIDAIYVATPHVFHYEHSLMALKAGKAVLCEKPLNENTGKTEQLIQKAREHQRYLAEGMWTYFLPAVQMAQKWVNEGRIGELLHIKSDFGFAFPYNPANRKFNPALGGGAVLDMGIYTIAISHLLMQKQPEQLSVFAHKAPTGVDDDVLAVLNYGKVRATLHTSFRAKLHNQTHFIGTESSIVLPDFWRASECYWYQGETLKERFSDNRQGFGFNFEIDAVSRDLQLGKLMSDIMPHETTLALMKQMQRVIDCF